MVVRLVGSAPMVPVCAVQQMEQRTREQKQIGRESKHVPPMLTQHIERHDEPERDECDLQRLHDVASRQQRLQLAAACAAGESRDSSTSTCQKRLTLDHGPRLIFLA
jgi:hypothetical protein